MRKRVEKDALNYSEKEYLIIIFEVGIPHKR